MKSPAPSFRAENVSSATIVSIFLAFIAALLLGGTAIAADPRDSGPLTLVVTYQTTPANRLELRRYMEDAGIRQFQNWKSQGLLQSYRVLASRYVDSDTWDFLALLNFASYSDVARWKKVEAATPAGLTAKALALTTSIHTAPVDLMREGKAGAEASSAGRVLLVIPYDYFVSSDDYVKYVDGYVLPQVRGWMDEGIVAQYGVYLSRYSAGAPWDSMLIYEYKNDQALGARDVTIDKVRARLQSNPDWKALSGNKQQIRTERQPVIADELMLGASGN